VPTTTIVREYYVACSEILDATFGEMINILPTTLKLHMSFVSWAVADVRSAGGTVWIVVFVDRLHADWTGLVA
jgi:hypothetical protein